MSLQPLSDAWNIFQANNVSVFLGLTRHENAHFVSTLAPFIRQAICIPSRYLASSLSFTLRYQPYFCSISVNLKLFTATQLTFGALALIYGLCASLWNVVSCLVYDQPEP